MTEVWNELFSILTLFCRPEEMCVGVKIQEVSQYSKLQHFPSYIQH